MWQCCYCSSVCGGPVTHRHPPGSPAANIFYFLVREGPSPQTRQEETDFPRDQKRSALLALQITLHKARDLAAGEELYAMYGAEYAMHRDYEVGKPARSLPKSPIQFECRPAQSWVQAPWPYLRRPCRVVWA